MNSLFTVTTSSPGADGDGGTVYTLELGTNTTTNLVDTATGQAVVLSLNASGEVEGRTETSGDLVFTLSVDGQHALENYLRRGFRIWKRRAVFMTFPDSLALELGKRVESARARGVHPGFLRHVEARLRDSLPGRAARRIVYEIRRAARRGTPSGSRR